MTHRDHAPLGAPCWTDLWTSDVEGSRRFYCDLFGWEAEAPSPEFGGYFMFTREGIPVAGGMGDMGDMRADNSWKVYLDTPAIATTVDVARAKGAETVGEIGDVADLGIQAVLVDPTGATLGAWQPGTFPGFVVLNEHGAPSWFELHTRDFATAVDFYESVFQWKTEVVGDTDDFRYSTMQDPGGGDSLAGIMDAANFLPDGIPAHWSVYWEVDDASAAVARVQKLGGSVVDEPVDTPYGRLATVTDPAGARFKFRQSNTEG
jgi:predicted enzyme related to lactoylglutathione lyase